MRVFYAHSSGDPLKDIEESKKQIKALITEKIITEKEISNKQDFMNLLPRLVELLQEEDVILEGLLSQQEQAAQKKTNNVLLITIFPAHCKKPGAMNFAPVLSIFISLLYDRNIISGNPPAVGYRHSKPICDSRSNTHN